MESDYYKVTAELDAREILRYLNNQGIHNISGEVLKYFITDLKKLIKYDLENRHKNKDEHEKEYAPGPERLHSASTFSSRVRSKVNDGAVFKCTRECQDKRKVLHVRNVQSYPNLAQQSQEKLLRRACSCVRVEKKPESKDSAREKATVASSNNLIKVVKPPASKKCDPVSLYHYYTALWAKYKPNVPGENDWANLRWSVRQKMAGNVPKQVPDLNLQGKENRASKTRP